MVAHAICLRCGEEKIFPLDPCAGRRFDPADRPDAVDRSIYLSEFRFSDPTEQEEWLNELDSVAGQLRRGEAYIYPEAELLRMRAVREQMTRVPGRVVARTLFRFFWPALWWLAFLWIVILLVRTIL